MTLTMKIDVSHLDDEDLGNLMFALAAQTEDVGANRYNGDSDATHMFILTDDKCPKLLERERANRLYQLYVDQLFAE